MPSFLQNRREQLIQKLGRIPIAIYAGNPRPRNYAANPYPYRADSHFLYLTGAQLPGAILVGYEHHWELFTTPPTAEDALWHGPSASWDELRQALAVDKIRPLQEFTQRIRALGGPENIATLPAIDPWTRFHQAQTLQRSWKNLDSLAVNPASLADKDARLADVLIELRLVHDDAALTMLRQAAKATAAGHLAGMAATKPGLREHDIRAAMEGEWIARGLCPAYNSIITVHGEVLHHNTYHNELAAGDLLLVDAGAEYEGWASDVTRVWPVSGRFSSTQQDLYTVVLLAQQKACDRVRPNTRYRDLHLATCIDLSQGLVDLGILRGKPEDLVERGAHALFFPHGLGHLLGLDVHDMEDLGDRAGYAPGRTRSQQFGLSFLRLDRDLKPGMLVTIEPGFYQVPAILNDRHRCEAFDRDGTLNRARLQYFADARGIRIEDDVLCTKSDPEILSAEIPKDIAGLAAKVGIL